MKNPDLFNESNSATYCPEDDKLRLYVGRVPREEYLALKNEGWTSTPKQDCDFSAVWSPSRYQTCLSYAGIVDDEDMDPAERAADRAERFSGYLEKRTGEALDRAEAYDDKDQFHGYQSEAKAARAVAKHDRLGSKAVDAWSKAEYWQRRTAGVIGHALHKSRPDVRMGRIKTLESELRKREKDQSEWVKTWKRDMEIINDPEPLISQIMTQFEKDRAAAERDVIELVMPHCYKMAHPRNGSPEKLYIFELLKHSDPLTMEDFFNHWKARFPNEPTMETPWIQHLKLRLAYENQMLEAQGGRAGAVEIIPGGWIRGGRRVSSDLERQIVKVNKSPVTGRVVSVEVRDSKPSRFNHYGNPFPNGEEKVLHHVLEVERMDPEAYRAPTVEELATFNAAVESAKKAKAAAAKEKAKKGENCPAINPTKEDAERLMLIWNERAADAHAKAKKEHRTYGEFKPGVVKTTVQATWSEAIKGTYARYESRPLDRGAVLLEKRSKQGLCKVRIGPSQEWFTPPTIIILSDKPQKPFPSAVWEAATLKV